MSRVSSTVTTVARTFETRVVNPTARWLLRSSLHWLASCVLVLVTYRGRQSGRTYAIPVAYARTNGTLVTVTPKSETVWWTNFRESVACTLRLRGRRRTAHGTLVDDDDRAELLATYAEQRPILGRLLGIDATRAAGSSSQDLAVVRFVLEDQ